MISILHKMKELQSHTILCSLYVNSLYNIPHIEGILAIKEMTYTGNHMNYIAVAALLNYYKWSCKTTILTLMPNIAIRHQMQPWEANRHLHILTYLGLDLYGPIGRQPISSL